MRRILGILLLTIVVFYHIYPAALPVPFLGYSFIFATGGIGLVLFLYNGKPYSEMITIMFAYFLFGFFCILSGYTSLRSDPYLFDNTKSQVAWLFSAYFVVYLYYQIHPKGSFVGLVYYIIAAVCIQGMIAVLMYRIPAVDSFFSSIQMTDWLAEARRAETEGERLLGYGTAFFGAGIIYGLALILVAYVLVKKRYNTVQMFFLSAVYAFIFFVGVLTARTTTVGLAASVLYLIVVFILDKSTRKGQFIKFAAFFALFASAGYTLVYTYFPEFADWAFEVFINYSETGEIRTQSSDSIEYMFILPKSFDVWMFGSGNMRFWGSDVGYSRLLFYIGLPGTIAFFFYQFILAKTAMTKDRAQSILMLVIIGYVLALNVKGLADVNAFFYMFVFYFLHYRYFIYTPKLERLGKFNSTKLRYAVQRSSANRRIQSDV